MPEVPPTLSKKAAEKPKIINFNDSAIRVVLNDGNCWFFTEDLHHALNPDQPAPPEKNKGGDHRHIAESGPQAEKNIALTSEAGLYRLACASPEKQASEFKEWIAREMIKLRFEQCLAASQERGCAVTDAAKILSHTYDVGSGRLWSILHSQNWIYRKYSSQPRAQHEKLLAGYLITVPQKNSSRPLSQCKRIKRKFLITGKGIMALAALLDGLGLAKENPAEKHN